MEVICEMSERVSYAYYPKAPILSLSWIEKFSFNTLPVFERAQINAQNVSFNEKGPCVNNKKDLPYTGAAGLCYSRKKV